MAELLGKDRAHKLSVRIRERQEQGRLSTEYINSERIISLLDEVWLRLPELDQHILSDQVGVITDDPNVLPCPETSYGSAGHFMGVDLIDGLSTVLPDDRLVFLNPQSLGDLSDPAAKAVIAHELAHVILRHNCLGVTIGIAGGVLARERAMVRDVHEWEADLQVWIWGFSSELRCLWPETRHGPPVWYHQAD